MIAFLVGVNSRFVSPFVLLPLFPSYVPPLNSPGDVMKATAAD